MGTEQIYTVIGVNIALIAALATLILWSINKVDVDVKALGNRLDRLDSRMDGHASRIDQLYQMFIQLIKERK